MDYEKQRIAMVERQLEPRGITNLDVLGAMAIVPRELFVPEDLRHLSYTDSPLPIDCAQTISQPYIVAYMAEVLNLKASDHVLELGTGSGYNAAILAEIVAKVTTLEIIPALATEARQRLARMGYTNIEVLEKDGHEGHAANAPYDAIILTAGTEAVPQAIFDQLSPQGKLLAPVGTDAQNLYLYQKINGKIQKTLLMPVRFVPLVDRQFLIDKEIIRDKKNYF